MRRIGYQSQFCRGVAAVLDKPAELTVIAVVVACWVRYAGSAHDDLGDLGGMLLEKRLDTCMGNDVHTKMYRIRTSTWTSRLHWILKWFGNNHGRPSGLQWASSVVSILSVLDR